MVTRHFNMLRYSTENTIYGNNWKYDNRRGDIYCPPYVGHCPYCQNNKEGCPKRKTRQEPDRLLDSDFSLCHLVVYARNPSRLETVGYRACTMVYYTTSNRSANVWTCRVWSDNLYLCLAQNIDKET